MKKILKIDQLTFAYDNYKVFDNFNMELDEGTFTTLVGPNSSGKSTLVSLIMNKYTYTGTIEINNKNIKNIDMLKNNIVGVLNQDMISDFNHFTVLEWINYYIKDNDLDSIIKQFKIKHLLNQKIANLSDGERQIISLIGMYLKKPLLLICDDAFRLIDLVQKKQIFSILKKLAKDGITILNITSDIEESLYGNDVMLFNHSSIILALPVDKAFEIEKPYLENNLSLPFIAELSLKLKYYGLVNKIYLSNKKLVDYLWK